MPPGLYRPSKSASHCPNLPFECIETVLVNHGQGNVRSELSKFRFSAFTPVPQQSDFYYRVLFQPVTSVQILDTTLNQLSVFGNQTRENRILPAYATSKACPRQILLFAVLPSDVLQGNSKRNDSCSRSRRHSVSKGFS